MKIINIVVMIGVFGISVAASAEIIDFDLLSSPGSWLTDVGQTYTEDGYTITNLSPNGDFKATQSGAPEYYTGSTALLHTYGGSTAITEVSMTSGGAFNLISIDLSEIDSGRVGNTPVPFTGYLAGGGTVTQTVYLDGIFGHQTISLTGFVNLTSLTWANRAPYHQFDNIHVEAIPEPATLGLMGLCTFGLLFRRRRSRTCLLTGAMARRDSVDLDSAKKVEPSVGYVNAIKPYMNSKKRAKAHATTKWVNY